MTEASLPNASVAPATGTSVAARLDRLPITRKHLLATGVIGLGLFFDAYENFLASTIAAVLKEDFALKLSLIHI